MNTSEAQKLAQKILDKVAALENLTDAQREQVREAALSYVITHGGSEPSYEGLANHIRSNQ